MYLMHIYHVYTIPDINIKPFILHTGDEKLLLVTKAINYASYCEY